jgi:DNA-binding IclR family transcriptional regulator
MQENSSIKKKTGNIQSVSRAFAILEYLCKIQTPVSVIDISTATGIYRTTVYGLLNELLDDGYIVQSEIKNKYVISGKLYSMCYSYPNRLPVVRCADTYMKELVDQFNITSHLGVLNVDDSVLLVNVQFPKGRQNIRSGSIFPLHASGNGKVLLAFMDEIHLQKILDNCTLTKYTNKTITNKEQLLEEIALIRKRGYGIDMEEFIEGTVCIAFPIFGEDGKIKAALSLSGNKTSVLDLRDDIIRAGLNASKHCSMEMGWPLYRNFAQV